MAESASPTIVHRPGKTRLWRLLALGAVLGVAALLRFTDLANVPPGVWFDEALNGQDAWAVWQPGGHFRWVYPAEFPREPLWETVLALTVRLAGPNIVALRAVAATTGTLTVLLLYLFLLNEGGELTRLGRDERDECDHRDRRAWRWALCGAGVLATLRWHVLFSHLIFRTLILGPWMLGIVWAALALWRRFAEWRIAERRIAERRPTAGLAALLGALVGGGFYTYLAWYFLLPCVAGIALWILISYWRASRDRRAKFWRDAALLAGCAVLVFAPLGLHYLHTPEDLLARPGAVSVFSHGAATGWREVAKNAGEALLMFHWRGDHVPVQNIPWRPALDAIQGIFFLIGLGLCLGQIFRPRPNASRRPLPDGRALPVILLAWIACGLTATIFTHTDSPNFLRTLCIAPAVAAVTGAGLAGAAEWLGRRRRGLGHALIALALAASAAWTAYDVYFNWARRLDVWEKYFGNLRQLAEFARAAPPDVAVFVPQYLFEHRAFRFLTLGHQERIYPYHDWRGLLGPWPPSPLPPPPVDHRGGTAQKLSTEKQSPEPRRRWIIVTANNGLLEPLGRLVPEGGLIQGFRVPRVDGQGGNTWAAVYAVPEDALPPPATLNELARGWSRPMAY